MTATRTKAKSSGTAVLGAANEDAVASQVADGRLNCIATMAYYKAEARGFLPGKDVEDWLAAEAEFEGYEIRH